tara:strand:+ start:630 stop:1325 length:696 start_codon:yes stop_codon:yes gene_type:complete
VIPGKGGYLSGGKETLGGDVVTHCRWNPARVISTGTGKLADPGAGDVHLLHLDPVGPALLQDLFADAGKALSLKPGIKTRTIDGDHAREGKEALPAVPGRQFSNRIPSDNEKKFITPMAFPENLQGINHVAGAWTLDFHGTGLQEFDSLGSNSSHFKTMVHWRQLAVILLVRRSPGWEQENAVELVAGVNSLAGRKMPQVDGVEGASEYTDLHGKPGLLGQRDDSPGRNQG